MVTTAQSLPASSSDTGEEMGSEISTPFLPAQASDVDSPPPTSTPSTATVAANSGASANLGIATSAANPFAHLAMPTFSSLTSWLTSPSRSLVTTQNGDQTGVDSGINEDKDGARRLQASVDPGEGHQQASHLLNSTAHLPPHQYHAASNTLTQRDDVHNAIVRQEAEKEGSRAKKDGEREEVGTSLLTGDQILLDSTPVSNSVKPFDPPQPPLASLTSLTPPSFGSLGGLSQSMTREQAQRTPRSSAIAPVGSRRADAAPSTDKSVTAGQRNRGDAGQETKKMMAHHTAKPFEENYQALAGVAKYNIANNTWLVASIFTPISASRPES
jgi:hypothetical protein